MTVSPEIIAEQVMGYVVWASELIPTLTPPSHPYSIAILPQGPHFYTGLLQAAWYLLLDNKKRKLLIISEQQDDEKNILIDANDYGPIIWQTRKNSTKVLENIAYQLDAKLSRPEQIKIFENIHFQLPFLKVITETNEIINIGIGNQLTQKQLTKLLTWIKKHIDEYNIILLTNIELPLPSKSKKIDDQKQIAKLLTNSEVKRSHILTIFQKIVNFTKQKPEIVAYVNPGDFSKTWSLTTRYICAVG